MFTHLFLEQIILMLLVLKNEIDEFGSTVRNNGSN